MPARRFTEDKRRALEFIDRADGAGLVLARDIAAAVGWSPRTAGPRMRGLALQGVVEAQTIRAATMGTDRLDGYRLTDRGREILGRPPLVPTGPDDAALLDAASVGRQIGKLVAIALIHSRGDAHAALGVLESFAGLAAPQSREELDAVPIAQQAIREADAYLTQAGVRGCGWTLRPLLPYPKKDTP